MSVQKNQKKGKAKSYASRKLTQLKPLTLMETMIKMNKQPKKSLRLKATKKNPYVLEDKKGAFYL